MTIWQIVKDTGLSYHIVYKTLSILQTNLAKGGHMKFKIQPPQGKVVSLMFWDGHDVVFQIAWSD